MSNLLMSTLVFMKTTRNDYFQMRKPKHLEEEVKKEFTNLQNTVKDLCICIINSFLKMTPCIQPGHVDVTAWGFITNAMLLFCGVKNGYYDYNLLYPEDAYVRFKSWYKKNVVKKFKEAFKKYKTIRKKHSQ